MNKRLVAEIALGLRAHLGAQERAEATASEMWPRLAATGATAEDRDHLRDSLAGLFTRDEGRMEAALERLSMPALEAVMGLSGDWVRELEAAGRLGGPGRTG